MQPLRPIIAHDVPVARSVLEYWRLPAQARAAYRADGAGLPARDPGIEPVIEATMDWLCRAQDHSASSDGGVARHFSLISGWGPSYPETTGYIVPTVLTSARLRGDAALRARARRMLDWLVSIQLPCGAFAGGVVGAEPAVPVVFNTGQVLLGLAHGVREFGDRYRAALTRAADWLVDVQDADGCWRRYGSPFAAAGEKAYDAHVAWGLLEAAALEPKRPYAEAALANVRWVMSRQRDNGWVESCCLSDPSQPLTHTLGYALRGVLEAHRFSEDPGLLQAARATADGLRGALGPDGFLPGRLDAGWRGTVGWSCLTGSAQVAACWLMLSALTGDARYRDAAFAVNAFVRRTVQLDGPPDVRGGVKGAFPIHGAYGPFEYLNWAAKFLIDALLLERDARTRGPVS